PPTVGSHKLLAVGGEDGRPQVGTPANLDQFLARRCFPKDNASLFLLGPGAGDGCPDHDQLFAIGREGERAIPGAWVFSRAKNFPRARVIRGGDGEAPPWVVRSNACGRQGVVFGREGDGFNEVSVGCERVQALPCLSVPDDDPPLPATSNPPAIAGE